MPDADEMKADESKIVTDQDNTDPKTEDAQADEQLEEGQLQEDDLQEEEEELSPLAQAEQDRDGYKDQLYRAVAEMENAKKRAQRDIESANKYGAIGFIRDLTTPFDNLQRAMSSAPENRDDLDETYKNILIGLEMTISEIAKIMEKHGVEIIDPTGEKFDYNNHQAMFEVPTDEAPAGTVVSVAQTGYRLHDRLIRPAMVGVAKAPEDPKS